MFFLFAGGQEQIFFSPLLHPPHGIGGQEGFSAISGW